MKYQDIIKFWFEEHNYKDWFNGGEKFDEEIRERFFETYEAASRCELASWRDTAEGRLAEIIVLDQFPRNLFRRDPRSFQTDPLALTLAQEAVLWRYDRELEDEKATFVYMPYMHSESRMMQKQSTEFMARIGSPENKKFAALHADIIERFGRFPHRNAVLGRTSTLEEIEFLKQPNSSF